jgi:transposase-like protein
MGYTFRFFCKREVWMPWKASSVMEERLRFVARLLDGEAMTDVCREFGVSRKTGYKIFDRYKEHGLEALSDRSRRPVRYANQLPEQIEGLLSGSRPRSRTGARARSGSCWSDGWTAISGFRPKAPSMRSSTAMAWSSVAAGGAGLD